MMKREDDGHILCICCIHVFEKKRPIRFVGRDENAPAEYLCGETDHFSAKDGKAVGFGHLKDYDDTIPQPSQIKEGRAATRENKSSDWVWVNYIPNI